MKNMNFISFVQQQQQQQKNHSFIHFSVEKQSKLTNGIFVFFAQHFVLLCHHLYWFFSNTYFQGPNEEYILQEDHLIYYWILWVIICVSWLIVHHCLWASKWYGEGFCVYAPEKRRE
jgi:hypothetical protein